MSEQTYEEWLAEVQRKREERKAHGWAQWLDRMREIGGGKNPVERSRRLKAIIRTDPCCYCGRHVPKQMTTEHLTPRSHGGRDVWENLASACRPCNQERGNGPFLTFLARKRSEQSRLR